MASMPLYEYACRECGTEFDDFRAIAAADEPAACPDGHTDTLRKLSLIAPRARGSDGAALPLAGGGGACCGGGCCA